MPSPFPGMNPYLERAGVFHDFHTRFITAAAEMLLPQVRPKYIVTLHEHAYVHELPAEQRRLIGRPDVLVARSTGASAARGASATIEAPAYGVVPVAIDVEQQPFIEIRDRDDNRLVTVIELLSPANKKPGGDREQYISKRWEYLRSTVNLVEIDLLRAWPRLPVEGLTDCDYCVLVRRGAEWARVGLWPLKLRDPLPVIPAPLGESDPAAQLDLRALIHRVYDAAGYEDYVYSRDPEPPLSQDDANWAQRYLPRLTDPERGAQPATPPPQTA